MCSPWENWVRLKLGIFKGGGTTFLFPWSFSECKGAFKCRCKPKTTRPPSVYHLICYSVFRVAVTYSVTHVYIFVTCHVHCHNICHCLIFVIVANILIFRCLIGLSYVIQKDLCEARVNLEESSYLADKPSLTDGPPVNQE